ncbi:hypothetical protein HMPREF0666_01372 [Prevotella sp. C561]|uniref:HipA N-terminal domain-containing protein n=1 Tax=Prevotella sp. C561 TaxID=563031 RepID=UPI00022380A9|nr:HipA N-terminal domain-containing protein [Prevotella sp. C561]EGW47495.1 hypothetical protein HMPREF0666_01372 [Prevotella sp. C561]
MRQGQVFVKNQLASIITEDETGYDFTYAQAYLDSDHPTPVSLTLPLSKKDYQKQSYKALIDSRLDVLAWE